MRASSTLILSIAVGLLLAVQSAEAQGQRGPKMQRNGGAAKAGQNAVANAGQNGFQACPGGQGLPGQGADTIAQMMITNFDQNGDSQLNLVELQFAVAALMQEFNAQRLAGGGNMAMGLGQAQGMQNQMHQRHGGRQVAARGGDAGQGRGGPSGGKRGGKGGGIR